MWQSFLLRSQTFMKTSKNFMEKMTKGMYYSYKQNRALDCVLQLLLDRVSLFASQRHCHPINVEWNHVVCY